MSFLPKKRVSSSVINLTPLIDCMFLLVIFIMIAARFESEAGIPVDLPTAKSKEAPKVETLNLTVTVDGDIYLGDEQVSLDDLDRKIVEARTVAGDPDGERIVLVIHGDKDAHHGRIVQALDAATSAKQRRVTIRTRE
ncbi:MAG: biopolymer transporter ExbD [Planctomycetota bacterium]|jgi:biopolymer transport protein ExbD|nr:biopolymer transporter ExbD [Planctomycetota bacterium]